ncbi:MAG: glycosyltransferase family 4 protein [Balneola sp.]|nr:glycosyltransferase family 4 protein [Balneola sp.]
MKILWITNTLFPDICKKLGIEPPVSGGWMYAGARALCDANNSIDLGVATLFSGNEFQTMKIKGINYFLIPEQNNKKYWKLINDKFQPNVTHIHGTEYPHGLNFVEACGNENVVVSIQGLVSVIERYYYGGISRKELRKNTTFRDYIRFDTLFRQRAVMQQRGRIERSLIQSVNHVIGRTSWDKSHVWEMNQEAKYHFCNETLRREFYRHKWDFRDCETHSIFLSQGHYPIKGFHQVIKALPIILRQYPNTKVYLAGRDFLSKPWWRINGYGKYLKSLITKFDVKDKINYTGLLEGDEMRDRYLKSTVFVCPSAIENSPNSVGEAQILGVPVVASYVGGTPDMIEHEETGLLYPYEEIEMLADAVCRIFKDNNLSNKLSNNEQQSAQIRHSQTKNANDLNNIYKYICNY